MFVQLASYIMNSVRESLTKYVKLTDKEENKISFFSKDIATYLMMGQVKMCIPKFLLSKNETGLY